MKEYLVIDGYNIIFAWPDFEKLKERDLEHARSKLVEIMANHSPLSGQKIVIVFDAYQQKNTAGRVEIIDGVEVVYTKQGETADALIERLAGELSKEGTVYVATSDWAEQGIVFGRGAYRLTPGELRTQVNQAKQDSEERWTVVKPVDSYLENRLLDKVRINLEKLYRRKK
ncbi:MAG: YacP-like NYN domain protein [Pelotomaculum sp. PtaU1.Bin035]|nr:MAG: YacP-like NYN domain protein [Pelotomaculum sp. PtaU1.Bin035]